ncbi:unnamed protein product [Heligmosomoides polygyrus]|uniref:ShKT domain-containing protein n=1 Tax=Heligmosomoides polygyrus TaxID=6339 RepID=A0A3P8E8G5_HELPZ|nr:unnamed protein product [Heligmosomoides polygyrus]
MQREMKQKCAKTCDLCTAPTPAPQTHHPPSTTPSLGKPTTTLFPFWYPSCWDRESLKYCNDAKANGYCTRPDKWRDMRLKCEQTCDLCGQPTPVPITVPTVKCPEPDDFWNCLDRESRKFCNDAYAKGYCTRRDKWYEMRIKCEETCGLCNDPKPSPRIGYDTTPTKPRPICTNTKGEKYCDDAYAKGYCERADKWREMRMGCAAKCDFCNDPSPPPLSYDHSSTTHEDRHEKVCEDKGGTAFCDKSFVFGYCKMPEKRAEMKTKCARKCGFCEESTTQPSSSTSKTGEKMEFTTPPSPRTTKAQEKVESTTPPSPSTTKAEEKIESTTPPSPITTKAEEKIESTTPPSPSTTKAEEKVESTTPPSPSTTKAEEKVESTTLPSPSTTKAEEKVESTTSPGPSTTKAGEKICKNEKPSTHCRELLESGHCEDPMMITIVKEDCAKTCGLCPAPTETTVCEDMASEYKCKRWQQSGYCSSQELYPVMKEFCEKTCELCGGGQGIGNRSISTTGKGEGELTTSLPVLRNRTEVCKNKQSNTHCREVFESGQCDDTFMYVIVKEDCPKTCGLCPSTSGDEVCANHLSTVHCREVRESGQCDDLTMYVIVKEDCPKECGLCPNKADTEVCRDKISEKRCKKWRELGYCSSKKDFLLMKESCKKTCGFCERPGPSGYLPGEDTTNKPSTRKPRKGDCYDKKDSNYCETALQSGKCDDVAAFTEMSKECAMT